MPSSPGSPVDKFVGICISLLVGAAAVFIAVKLIEAIWTALLVIIGVGGFLGIAWLLLHDRQDRW